VSWNEGRTIDILIPARNEEEALPVLLGEIDRAPIRQIVVVDNGSSDRTAQVAREAGCTVVACPTPGYGIACLTGLAHMRQDPPEIIVFLDGDRSDHPHHLPELCKPILEGTHDFVIGSRVSGTAEKGSLTATQRFGNWLATRLMRLFWKTGYTDLGPFRAIRWESLKALKMQDKTYGWTVEMQVKAAKLGLKSVEVPVSYRNRIGKSKVSGTIKGSILAGNKILYTIFVNRLLIPGPVISILGNQAYFFIRESLK